MAKTWISRVLLTFVIFTLGYGIGKEVGGRKGQGAAPEAAAAPGNVESGAAEGTKVVVTYMHTTFRCVTCNTIEKMAREVVENDFPEHLADGRVEWHEVDFQENEGMARRYDIVSSTVVVAKVVNGAETGFQRLDDVWTLVGKPAEFKDTIAKAIRASLSEAGG